MSQNNQKQDLLPRVSKNLQGKNSINDCRQDSNSISEAPEPVQKFDILTKTQFWAYGVGHFINDLTSACWFNYLLYYLSKVVKVNFGPYSILSGQVADALATPMVGYLSDRTQTKIGKRIPWYIGGYVILLLTFVPMWDGCLLCEWTGNDSQGIQIFYYIFFPAIFNFGWASLQISHMSLVPSLSCCRFRRDGLNTLRNTFSFLAILLIYCIAVFFFFNYQLVLFQYVKDPLDQFQYLSFIAMGVGSLTTFFFLALINETKLTSGCAKIARQLKKMLKDRENEEENTKAIKIQRQTITYSDIRSISDIRDPDIDNSHISEFECKIDTDDKIVPELGPSQDYKRSEGFKISRVSVAEEIISWKQWFTELAFYRYGIVYMGVRLYCNVSSTIITFYLITVLEFQEKDSIKTPIQIALVPLSLYLMSAITSSLLDKVYRQFGKKYTFTLGTFLCVGASISFVYLTPETKNYMYFVAPVMGIAQAINLNTGITLISDVIGLRGSYGAFVFGFYSFLDKISAGVVLFLCTNSSHFEEPEYIRWIMVLVPSISCVLAWILVILPIGQSKIEDTNLISGAVTDTTNPSAKRPKSQGENLGKSQS